MKKTVRLLLSLFAVISLASIIVFGADRRFEKRLQAQPGGLLRLKTDVGSVTVSGTSGNEVSILAELRGEEREVHEFNLTATQTTDGVEVIGRRAKRGWFWNSRDLDVRFTIKVPERYNLELKTSGGKITISSLKGNVQGGTSGGDLHLNGVEGDIRLETSGGNVKAEMVSGDLHMRTSGGNIQIGSTKGVVDVGTSGGNVRITDASGKVRATTSGGNVLVRLTSENNGVFAQTSGGDIEIGVRRNIAATVDASTSGGEVTCDLPITISGKIRESKMRGTINGGGNTIQARTSGGDIRIRAVD